MTSKGARTLFRQGSGQIASAYQRALMSTGPRIAKASVAAESEDSTSTVFDRDQSFVVDEPVALGGQGTGPSPLAHFLGSLIGCTQITLRTIADEQKIKIGGVRWKATGKFDLRGLRGQEGAIAKFQEIYLLGEVETFYPERRLKELTEEIKRRCIISATIGAGTELTTELKAAPSVFKSSMGVWIDHHH